MLQWMPTTFHKWCVGCGRHACSSAVRRAELSHTMDDETPHNDADRLHLGAIPAWCRSRGLREGFGGIGLLGKQITAAESSRTIRLLQRSARTIGAWTARQTQEKEQSPLASAVRTECDEDRELGGGPRSGKRIVWQDEPSKVWEIAG